ncbi:MAG: 2-C-methyl-D-erythritol 4-phosphate cytidylyltransferase, partial [Dehalococcoidia bacterium]|nr:2-C-methyl-D-erythritol 4-phosphate cytidylyltransferase [Dehalococcoidia bacterium]
ALGYRVKVYMGSYDNIKVTTEEDLTVAEAILRLRRET